MTMAFTYEDCVKLMPELKRSSFDITELKGGITNRLYRVKEDKGRDYVFRFYGRKTELFIDRDMEMENLRLLSPLGITPKLIRYFPEGKVTIVEFIPGYALKNEDFLKESFWQRIISPIRTIHHSGIHLAYFFNPIVEIKRLFRILEGINAQYPEFDIHGTIKVLEKISEVADVPLSEYVPCHNDLLADNFICTEEFGPWNGAICLIDWEYGGMAPPWYDLADMFQEILVPREVEGHLLALYEKNIDIERSRYLTDLFKPFPDIYWFLWSLIQHNISKIDFDYYQYGKVKYDNAQNNVNFIRDHYGL